MLSAMVNNARRIASDKPHYHIQLRNPQEESSFQSSIHVAIIWLLIDTVDFIIFEKSQFPVDLPGDDLNEQNATEIGFSSRMHMHRDEKLISVAFYSFKSFME